MTSSRIERIRFDSASLADWAGADPKTRNWPVVYTIDGQRKVYVGETIHFVTRMRQHLARPDRKQLTSVRVVIDETFNKSVCLDLESFLIQMFAGDGKYQVENANAGLVGSDYYDRDLYRERFLDIFERLRADGLFEKSVNQIENTDLFKLSPYKELNEDQRFAVMEILEQLFTDLRSGQPSTVVVQGQPGTGKTIVGIYLMKVLADIKRGVPVDEDSDALLAGFFTERNTELLADFRMALVIPQQSLRKTVGKVFSKTSGLDRKLVLSPFEVGDSTQPYDLLIVDEAHRLQQLSSTLPTLTTKFKTINRRLFGDETGGHQLDWIQRASRHQLYLLDPDQTVKPADLPAEVVHALQSEAVQAGRAFALATQMRVRAGEDYVAYVRGVLSPQPPTPVRFAEYDLRMFDDIRQMRSAILEREREVGLARLVAGYAWKWASKTDKSAFDIEIDGLQLQWNKKPTDWINSATSIDEVGSVHTTQGYDLNYAGVIIGPDLTYDTAARRLRVDRSSYFDTKGKANNGMLGLTYDDDDLLAYIRNIYAVLMTRGIRGTYVYVCDPALRAYLRDFIPSARSSSVPDIMHPPAGLDDDHRQNTSSLTVDAPAPGRAT